MAGSIPNPLHAANFPEFAGRWLRAVIPVVAIVTILGGCSSSADWAEPGSWFGSLFEDDTPRLAEAEGKPKPRTTAATSESDGFPSLADTPEAPESSREERDTIVAGLLADRENAQYTEQAPAVTTAQRRTDAAASRIVENIRATDDPLKERAEVAANQEQELVPDNLSEDAQADIAAVERGTDGNGLTDRLIEDVRQTDTASALGAAQNGISAPPADLNAPTDRLVSSDIQPPPSPEVDTRVAVANEGVNAAANAPVVSAQPAAQPTALTAPVAVPVPSSAIQPPALQPIEARAVDPRLSAPPPVQPTITGGAPQAVAAVAAPLAAIPAPAPPAPSVPQPIPLATVPGAAAARGTDAAFAAAPAVENSLPAAPAVPQNQVPLPVGDDQAVLAQVYRQHLTRQAAPVLITGDPVSFRTATRTTGSVTGHHTAGRDDGGSVIVYNAAGVPVSGADFVTANNRAALQGERYPAYAASTASSARGPAGTTVITGGETVANRPDASGFGGPAPVAVLQFANGSAELNSRARRALRSLAKQLGDHNGYIRVVGHASQRTRNMSYDEHKLINFNISLDRANKVAAALSARGIRANQILVEARGDREPQYHEFMPEGEAQNRRVEIYLE